MRCNPQQLPLKDLNNAIQDNLCNHQTGEIYRELLCKSPKAGMVNISILTTVDLSRTKIMLQNVVHTLEHQVKNVDANSAI